MGLPPVPGAELKSIFVPNAEDGEVGTPERRRLLILGQTGVTFDAQKTGDADAFGGVRDEHSDGQGDETADDLYMQPTQSSAIRSGFALLSKETIDRERSAITMKP